MALACNAQQQTASLGANQLQAAVFVETVATTVHLQRACTPCLTDRQLHCTGVTRMTTHVLLTAVCSRCQRPEAPADYAAIARELLASCCITASNLEVTDRDID
jgi:hypothetical protein